MSDEKDDNKDVAAAAAAGAGDDEQKENTTETAMSKEGEMIAQVLRSKGPIVKCVLLQHIRKTGRDVKPHKIVKKDSFDNNAVVNDNNNNNNETNNNNNDNNKQQHNHNNHTHHHHHSKKVLTELIQEVDVDTTPKNKCVEQILGGPFTFIGQYPDEGIVLMARKDQFIDIDKDINKLSIKELKAICVDSPDITYDDKSMLEKSDLIDAIRNAQLPINPHKLQPPLHTNIVRGDILVMRVAGDEDENENEDNNEDNDNNINEEVAIQKAVLEFQKSSSIPNDEFFLNYTKEEYITFASRTDIVAKPLPTEEENDDEEEEAEDDKEEGADEEKEENGDGNEDDDDEEEDDDDEYIGEDLDEEEEKRAVLNIILGEVLKKFRHEHGRGPDSEELLNLRKQVATKLGVHLDEPIAPTSPTSPEVVSKKRKNDDTKTPENSPHSNKKVKFTPDVIINNTNEEDSNNNIGNNDDDDDNNIPENKKPAAATDYEVEEGEK